MSGLSISTRALLYVAEPMITSIVNDIVKSTINREKLTAIRDSLFQAAVDLTGKTSFTIDDVFVASLINALKSENAFERAGDAILDAIEAWVKASETQWDDKAILPITQAIREAAGIVDTEK